MSTCRQKQVRVLSQKSTHIRSNSGGCSELCVPAGGNRGPDKGHRNSLALELNENDQAQRHQPEIGLLGYSAHEDKSSERNDSHIPVDHKFMGNVSELQLLLTLYLQAEDLRKSFVYDNRA